MRVQHLPCGQAANESERKALAHVKSRIESTHGDDEWILLTNLAFSVTHQLQSDEIDMIAIGPPGVRVIEVKHWTTPWVEANADLVEQEADKVANKARKIGTTLRRTVPKIGYVGGVILLTRDSPKAEHLFEKRVRGVDLHTLRTWRGAVGFDPKARPVLSPSQVTRLGRTLAPKGSVALDGTLRRFAGYVNLELQTPKTERFRRVYSGVHSVRQDRVILHLYDLSAINTTKAEAKARREFEALHRLQRHDWAPRILDSFQSAPGYPGEMHFFTVVDSAAPSIKKRVSDSSWDTQARLGFARAAVGALKDLHESSREEALVHRNLTPRTILVRHDNMPIFTDFRFARIPSDVSIASSEPPPEGWGPEVAPEIRSQDLHAAGHFSDVYSLCVCLTGLFQERDDEISRQVIRALQPGLADDASARVGLKELESGLARLLGESPPNPPPPPARFWTEDQEVRFQGRDYRVVACLGSGGGGTTYKVVETDRSEEDRGTYVAKVAHDQDAGRRTTHAYVLARPHVGRHPALSAIFEVAPQWQKDQFTALMTWIEGSPLRDFLGVFTLLAEEQGDNSGEALALRWLRSMCEALDVFHRNGLVHGDVSPANMIVSGHDLVLTDYDFVAKLGEKRTTLGTVPYCAPSGRPVQRSDDIYALAASFFHLFFEREPFLYDGAIAKDQGLNWEGLDRGEYAMLANFFDRATHPDPAQRFGSVTEALDVLRTPATTDGPTSDISGTELPATAPDAGSGDQVSERREEHIEHLGFLLQSYPGSVRGNSETRGLDTPFAEQTYVETDFEEKLYQDLLNRRVRLVVLCGNAGDGKTALLQHLAKKFGIENRTSSERILKGTTGDGLAIQMHLDGSASWQEKSADVLLDEFLEPFQDGPPNDDIARLLAINDGRLLEWIESQETSLANVLLDHLDAANMDQSEATTEPVISDNHIRFISLNQRSLVGRVVWDGNNVEMKTAFLQDLVDKLYGGSDAVNIWAPCQTCSAQEHCGVFRATRIFAPRGVPGEPGPLRQRARERLFAALQAVHMRGETHITMRELRAALVYILFGIHECRDYHAGLDSPGMPRPQSYADRAFSPKSPGRQGEVLRELVRFDPALEAHPQIDRYLLRSPSSDFSETDPDHYGLPLASARRRAYFEWSEKDTERVAPNDFAALDLARGRHLRPFRDLAIAKAGTRKKLVERLCRGISRLQALPPLALDRPGVVPLRIPPRTPTETEFWVEKPLNAFRLEADVSSEEHGLDRLHRQVFLIYSYHNSDDEERLRLGADLFYLLLELSDGYQLGDDSTDDTFAHLSIFVQRLVREDHRQLYAWNPMREDRVHEVSARFKDTESKPRQDLVMAIRGDVADAQ